MNVGAPRRRSKHRRSANRSRLRRRQQWLPLSSSPSHSPQIRAKSTPAPAPTTTLIEQQLRLSVEAPQLLAAIEILLPLAKEEYRQLGGPQSSGCDPRIAELIKNEADAWAVGIALAEDSLQRIKPCPHLLVRYFDQLEKALSKAVQQ